MEAQKQLDEAFDNYLALSRELQIDLAELMDGDDQSERWRRNLIRASCALVEGYIYSIAQMCKVALECDGITVTSSERSAIEDERSFGATKRIKLTLRAAFKIFDVHPVPDFGTDGWMAAGELMAKRDSLMHPKSPDDFRVVGAVWERTHFGLVWVMEELFRFFELLKKKHLGDHP